MQYVTEITVLRNGQLVGEYEIADLPKSEAGSSYDGKKISTILLPLNRRPQEIKRKEPMVIEARGLSHARNHQTI